MSLTDESWTSEQRRAIETVDHSVLVGAAAGSGKTAVLARRCAYLVCEAHPPVRCNVDELLVVTFTEAAASEMRDRIGHSIREQLKRPPADPTLRYQLAALDGASISTIHAFCRRVLNQWFAAADLEPGFEILDPDEQLLLRTEAVEQVFAGLYDDLGDAGRRFRRLVDDYGDGHDRLIGEQVLKLAEYMESLVDPDAWLQAARKWVIPGEPGRLPDELLAVFLRRVRTELDWRLESCRRSMNIIRDRFPAGSHAADQLEVFAERLVAWRNAADSESSDAVDEITRQAREFKFPTLHRLRKKPDTTPSEANEHEQAKARFDEQRRAFRERFRKRWCQYTSAQLSDGLARMPPVVDTLSELLNRFRGAYQALKQRDGRLDFADLERRALNLLWENGGDNEVTRSLRRKYRYILVDEYQDTNPVQERIVQLVSREPAPHLADNLFCVGDVKQSIYRFRLAEPDIFVAREKRFRQAGARGEFIPLSRNFRSRAPLLEGINAVFERLMTGHVGPISYDDAARLFAGLDYPQPEAKPCVELHVLARHPSEGSDEGASEESQIEDTAVEWETAEREAYWVGRRVRQFMGMEPGFDRLAVYERLDAPGRVFQPRPVQFRDIVLLLRSMRHKAVTFARMLSALNIPVHADLATGYFESTEVRDVLSFLSLLDNRRQDIPLAAVLRSPLFAPLFDESDLAAIRLSDGECPFHEAFSRYARKGTDRDLAKRCAALLNSLDIYRGEIRRRPVAEVLWHIYADQGCLAYVSGMPGGRQRRANLIKLHERARQFGTFARQGLFRFLHFIRQLEERGQDLGAALPAAQSDDVVRIMSIHAAKGLEFPVVFLADLAKRFNFDDARGRILVSRSCHIGPKVVDAERGIEYPSVAHTLAADDLEAQTRAEEMRVLYVAMTRARERLILVGSDKSGGRAPKDLAVEWAGHEGPLPPLTVAAASSYLDWLVPALGSLRATRDQEFPAWIGVNTYAADVMRDWPGVARIDKADAGERQRAARLEPLPVVEPVAVDDPVVDRVIRRLSIPFGRDCLTTVPSVLAVTELRRGTAARDFDGLNLVRFGCPSREGKEEGGPFAAAGRSPRDSAADFGRAMHLVLERIDLHSASDPDQLRSQVDTLVERELLGRDLVDAIDFEAIRWFLETGLGMEVRRAADRVRRELMFVARIAPQHLDPAAVSDDVHDAVLIRGVIDVLIPGENGSQIIDYKTDRVELGDLPSRAEAYRSQLDLYARAAGQLGAGPVRRRWLVFLSPRRVWEV